MCKCNYVAFSCWPYSRGQRPEKVSYEIWGENGSQLEDIVGFWRCRQLFNFLSFAFPLYRESSNYFTVTGKRVYINGNYCVSIGKLKYSPIFYGYFTDQPQTADGYPLPLGYFMMGLAVYVYSFVAILRRYEIMQAIADLYTENTIIKWVQLLLSLLEWPTTLAKANYPKRRMNVSSRGKYSQAGIIW